MFVEGNPSTLLGEMQVITSIMENSMDTSQKFANVTTIIDSRSTTEFWCPNFILHWLE